MHKGTTIRVMANKNVSGEAIQANWRNFEKLTGIKVQYETFTEDQYRKKVLLELAAGPDRWTSSTRPGPRRIEVSGAPAGTSRSMSI